MRLLSASFLLPTLALATACGHSTDSSAADAAVLMTNGFEQSSGWGGADQPSLTTAQAHSGRTAVLVSPQAPFSYTFARTLDELSPGQPPQKMELTGWVLRTAVGSTAQLVVQLDASKTDETKVFYAALPVADAVPKYGEWTAVKLPLTLPATAVGTNKLKVYLWNDKATSPTYLDDVELRRQ